MTISSIMTTALTGMRTEQTRMAGIAGTVATMRPAAAEITSPRDTQTAAETSLASQLVDLKQAEIGFKANAMVFETGADLWDVLMSIKRD